MASTLPPSVNCSPRRSRIPLSLRRANYPSPVKFIRRKSSFILNVDSSEDIPSSHDSIYEAGCLSSIISDESLPNLPSQVSLDNENRCLSPTVPDSENGDDSQFIYGRGTVLNTIAEISTRNSNATLQTLTRPKSASEIHDMSLPLVDQPKSLTLNGILRRDDNFSFDDLTTVNGFYHEAITAIDRIPCEIYAEPKLPVQEAPERPPTPPGMPSWTGHQKFSRRRHNNTPPRNRFRHFFGLPALGSSSQLTNLSQGARDRSSSNSPIAPRFRPPKSVYGTLDRHPFNRVPSANLPLGLGNGFPEQITDQSLGIVQRPIQNPVVPNSHRSSTPPITPRRHSILLSRPTSQIGTIFSLQEQCPHRTRHESLNLNETSSSSPPRSPTPLHQSLSTPPRLHPLWTGRSRRSDTNFNPPFDLESNQSISPNSVACPMSGGIMNPSSECSPAQREHLIRRFPLPPDSRPRYKPEPTHCWKCRSENIIEVYRAKIRKFLDRSVNCVLYICCGYDNETETESRGGSGVGWNGRPVAIESPVRNPTSIGYGRRQEEMP